MADSTNDSLRVFAIHPDADALATGAAHWIARLACDAVAERGVFSIALAGGSTPRATYQQLASGELANEVPWKKVVFAFGDERAVAQDHTDSNFRMANDSLLAKVRVPAKNVLRMPAERDDLDAAASEYESRLRKVLGSDLVFDLILLGIGEDGHTASIFPDVAEACRGPERVKAVRSSSPIAKGVARLSLTYPLLNAARRVAFLAAGANKAAILQRVIARDRSLPASHVNPRAGALCYLLDRAASS